MNLRTVLAAMALLAAEIACHTTMVEAVFGRSWSAQATEEADADLRRPARTEESDRSALTSLYRATGGPNWRRSDNWLTDRPVVEWHGVSADATGVVGLDLAGNGLEGSIPTGLGRLSGLRRLVLSRNRLSGPIPAGLGDLLALQVLDLSENNLTTVPPELGQLQALERLDLRRNLLHRAGPVPPGLGVLSRLRELDLSENALQGPIPAELGNLSELETLNLDGNRFTGSLPPELGRLVALKELSVSDGLGFSNNLTGPIPPELGRLSKLEKLKLADNALSGSIPQSLGGLAALRILSLSRNELTGPIPASLGSLSALRGLLLYDNALTGPIPPELGRLSKLDTLELAGNALSGSIPPSLGGLAALRILSLSRNELTGPIPPELGGLPLLVDLRLGENKLVGPIPGELANLAAVQWVDLSDNELTGPIPPQLGRLSGVDLDVSSNGLSGTLPSELGGIAVRALDLSSNKLTGPIPASFLDNARLSSLAWEENAGLCLPAATTFREWRRGLDRRSGPLCPDPEATPVSPLERREYDLWEGDWFAAGSNVEENVYELLAIAADAVGFTYQFVCRSTPYGGTSMDEARALFFDPLSAEDEENGQSFALTVDPGDRHVRVIETDARSYGPIGGCTKGEGDFGNKFVYRRTTYKAGFDCDKAATPVETAICGNELIALGDLRMGETYRTILAESSDEDGAALRGSQRAWLRHRNRACLGGDEAVDDICLARIYADRLVALARLRDPELGTGPRLDSTYATTLLDRGEDPGRDTAVRLAMYPLDIGTSRWQADEGGIVFDSVHEETHIVWPANVKFRYSHMLFVGRDGGVWKARHIEPLLAPEYLAELNPHQVWAEAGGEAFTIWSEAAGESSEPPSLEEDVPSLVRDWLSRHPVTDAMRHNP